MAVLTVAEYGNDFLNVARSRLNALCENGLDCIYVDLPLANPATRTFGAELEGLGFFFGGVFPHADGDAHVLRLQYLNKVDVRAEDVSVASPFGQEILDYVTESRISGT